MHPSIAIVEAYRAAAKSLRVYAVAREDCDSFSFDSRERFRVEAAESVAAIVRILPPEKQTEVVGWLLRDSIGRVADMCGDAANEEASLHREWTIEYSR